MLYELRYYYIQPDKMPEFLHVMESLAIPFQLSQGMLVLGSFVDTEMENCYIWLRRYKDENDKKELYDRVYGSDYWENEVRPKLSGMLIREKTKINLLRPTACSILQ